jgi:hypothetical protein
MIIAYSASQKYIFTKMNYYNNIMKWEMMNQISEYLHS